MMSKEARQLMLSGQGAHGLELWKVGAAHQLSLVCSSRLVLVLCACQLCVCGPVGLLIPRQSPCRCAWPLLQPPCSQPNPHACIYPPSLHPPPHPKKPARAQNRWYSEKLGLPEDERRQVVQHYLEGLLWVLEYYYRGVASWNWYYPHHHAPMASDMLQLDDITGELKPLRWLGCVRGGRACFDLTHPPCEGS